MSAVAKSHARKVGVDPDVQARKSEAMIRLWADAEFRSRMSERLADPDVQARKSEALKKRWRDPAFRSRVKQRFAKAQVEP